MEEKDILNVRNNFSQVAGAYLKYRRDYPAKVYNLIYSFCTGKNSRVLDLGCGTGIVTKHLKEYYVDVIGTDKEVGMVDTAKLYAPEIKFSVSNAESIPYPDGSFDLITVASSYHWFNYDLAGKEIYRVLKPEGRLCVFWKYGRGDSKYYLPQFAYNNLRKIIPDVSKSTKEPVTEAVFHRAGFTKVDDEEFDFDDLYTKEEILGYVQSHSTFNLLDSRQKVEYMKMNDEDVDKYLVNGKYILESRAIMYFVEK